MPQHFFKGWVTFMCYEMTLKTVSLKWPHAGTGRHTWQILLLINCFPFILGLGWSRSGGDCFFFCSPPPNISWYWLWKWGNMCVSAKGVWKGMFLFLLLAERKIVKLHTCNMYFYAIHMYQEWVKFLVNVYCNVNILLEVIIVF